MTMIICFIGMLCIFSVCMMKKKAMGAKKMLSAGMIGILCVMNTSCTSAGNIVFEEVALETEIDENGFEWVKGTKILNGYYGEEVNVVIPEGCTEIRCMAFQTEEGKRIKSVTIPASVQELHIENTPGIFENCDNLEEIVIAEENDRYIVVAEEIRYRYKFDNYAGDKGRREVGYREALQKGEVVFRATWPEDKEVIENSKKILEKLNISEGTTEIEDRAFQYFEGFDITIPEGVKRIGEENFVDIPSFGVIVFPRSVEEVGWNTFYKSWALDEIIMIGKTQKEMEEILKLTAYDSGPNAKNVKLYTGLDLYLNGEKVDFDYTAPYIDERGTVRIPMIYVLNAAGIPSVNEITLEEVEAENWDIVYRLHMKKDGKEIAVTMSKVEANDVFGVISFTLDESKKILDLFDMEIKYDKKNYRLDVVSK